MRAEAMGTLDGHRRASNLTVSQRGSVHHLSDMGTVRSSFSLTDNATDDSFSITSGFGGHRTTTVESAATGTAASIIDGRPTFRRPLGCAVLELPQLSKLLFEGADKSGPGLEFSMPICVPREEETFATLHEDIINNRTKDVTTTPR
jgi:dedicator of cytokinesis protein 3